MRRNITHNPLISFWIFPHNKECFRLQELLNEQNGYVYWRNDNSVRKGNIVFIYGTAPEKRIKYMMEVVQDNIPISELTFDQSRFWVHISDWKKTLQIQKNCLMKLVKDVPSNKLSLDALHQQGLKGNIQGHRRIDGDLLDFILSQASKQ